MGAFPRLTGEAIQLLRGVFKEYTDKPVWVSWKGVRKADGKWTKPPIDPTTGKFVGPNDPLTCSEFQTAVTIHLSGKSDGIGINIEDTDLVGGDIDDCVSSNGVIEPAALEIIQPLNTYTELSPSGTGLRFFGLGKGGYVNRKQPIPGANGLKIEITRKGNKFYTLTGNVLDGYPLAPSNGAEIDPLADKVDAWARGEKPKEDAQEEREGEPKPKPRGRPKLDLDDVIKNGVPQGQRSEKCWWVINELMRRGKIDDEIIATMLDPDHKIGDHYRDHPAGAEITLRRHIREAQQAIENDWRNRAQRGRPTARQPR